MKITRKLLNDLGFQTVGLGRDQSLVYTHNSRIELHQNERKEWYYHDEEDQPIFLPNVAAVVKYIHSQGVRQGVRDVRGSICNALGICPSSRYD